MANYLTKNESFHIFSKSPVLSDMAVSQAVNKSGHTVSVSDVWSDDIPWFTEVTNEEEAIKRAGDAKYNDLILWGSNIYKRKGDKTNGASSGTTFENLWEEYPELKEARNFALSSVTNATPSNIEPKTIEIKNSSDRLVIKYHVGKPIELLKDNNNANVPSTWAARMFINDKVVDQFVSPTDKVFAGNPSTGYTTLVYTATTEDIKYTFVSEGEADIDFVNNAYAGIIQFNDSRESTHKFAASIFEYVGRKLDITDTIDDDTIDDDSKAVVPTSNAVHVFTDITKYYFPELDYEDRKDYIIYDASGNPTYISFADDIVDGSNLFNNSNIRKFTLTLPNLTNGSQMFMHNHYLQFVDSDFSKVTNGYRMFRATGSQMFDGDMTGGTAPYTESASPWGNQLKHFRGSLKSLTDGRQMFEGCVLDVDSVCYIIDSLQNENIATNIVTTKDNNGIYVAMTLGIDAQYKSDPTLLNKLNITEGAEYAEVVNKEGHTWTLTLQWNTRNPMWRYLQKHKNK